MYYISATATVKFHTELDINKNKLQTGLPKIYAPGKGDLFP